MRAVNSAGGAERRTRGQDSSRTQAGIKGVAKVEAHVCILCEEGICTWEGLFLRNSDAMHSRAIWICFFSVYSVNHINYTPPPPLVCHTFDHPYFVL